MIWLLIHKPEHLSAAIRSSEIDLAIGWSIDSLVAVGPFVSLTFGNLQYSRRLFVSAPQLVAGSRISDADRQFMLSVSVGNDSQ